MSISSLDIAVVLVYLVGIGALGLSQARKIHGSGDYFAGGRSFNKFLMVMHALGTGTHADDPVGVAGASYERGISGIWYTFVYLFATPFYWIIAPIFRRSRFLTTSDFFETRYGSGMGTLYAAMSVLVFTLNMAIMLKGGAKIVSAVTHGAVPEFAAIGAMALVFVSYGTLGGLFATVITESVQGLLIVVMSLLMVPFGLVKVGGFAGLHHLLTPAKFELFSSHETTLTWIITVAIVNLIGIVAQPHTMEVCGAGKTEWEGRIGMTFGAFVKRFCALGWMMTGVIVLALVSKGSVPSLGKHRELAFGTAIGTLLPPGFIGLMFAAILAAQMAALSAFMVAASALISRNIYRRHFRPGATDSEVLKFARFSGLGVVAMGVTLAFIVPGVADGLTYFWTVTSFTGVFMWAGVFWRRANATGAWISLCVMVAVWVLVGPIGILLHDLFHGITWLGIYGDKAAMPYLLACYLPAGILSLIIGSLLGKPRDKKKLDGFFLLLKTPVGREDELIEAGVEMVYAGQSKGHPWELKYPKLVNGIGFGVALLVSASFVAILWMISRAGV